MKHPVKKFKSLAVALKELEPFIRNGAHLQTGKPFKILGDMRTCRTCGHKEHQAGQSHFHDNLSCSDVAGEPAQLIMGVGWI
jgi:hypothetical protein